MVGAAVDWDCAVVAMAKVGCVEEVAVKRLCRRCYEKETSLHGKAQSFLNFTCGNRIPQA